MGHRGSHQKTPPPPRVLSSAPEELTNQRLHRLGEGVGKVVYASEHWVVRRERSASAIVALIVMWKLARRLSRVLPGVYKLFEKPSRIIRLLRVFLQAVILLVPRGFWYTTHIGEMWRLYRSRSERGERLAQARLRGTSLLPEQVAFPPTRVYVGGWQGWLRVDHATQRVEATLYARLKELAAAERFDEFELWLNRLLDFRQAGWQRGVFSVDAHLKNFGVCGDRVVLIDAGGLTNIWAEIDTRLNFDERAEEPHAELGLADFLEGRPDLAARFNTRWKAIVSRDGVRRHWPE
jgi:hypothetical protein